MRTNSVIGNIADHPVIESMEQTGWPQSYDPMPHVCPHCGRDLCGDDTLLGDMIGNILGCVDGCASEIVPDMPRICKVCGGLVIDSDAIYVNKGNGETLGCSLCCQTIRIDEFE